MVHHRSWNHLFYLECSSLDLFPIDFLQCSLRYFSHAFKDVRNQGGPNRGENQALVRAIPFCGDYPGPRFENKFRSANQMDGISIAGGGKMADR